MLSRPTLRDGNVVEMYDMPLRRYPKNSVLWRFLADVKTGDKTQCRLVVSAAHRSKGYAAPVTAGRTVHMACGNVPNVAITQAALMQRIGSARR